MQAQAEVAHTHPLRDQQSDYFLKGPFGMSTPACGSSLSGRGTGRRNHGTQHAVTQTPYQTRGTTRGAREGKLHEGIRERKL